MPPPTNTQLTQNERNIQLALQAIKQDATLSMRHAVKIYNVPRITLSTQLVLPTINRFDWKFNQSKCQSNQSNTRLDIN